MKDRATKKSTRREIIDTVIENKLTKNYLEFTDAGCFKIKKLTEKYVVFKCCYEDGIQEIKWVFEEEMEGEFLFEVLKRKRKSHFHFNTELGVNFTKKPKRLSKQKKVEIIELLVDTFKKVYMSDIAEYLEIHPLEARKILIELKKKRKSK